MGQNFSIILTHLKGSLKGKLYVRMHRKSVQASLFKQEEL